MNIPFPNILHVDMDTTVSFVIRSGQVSEDRAFCVASC